MFQRPHQYARAAALSPITIALLAPAHLCHPERSEGSKLPAQRNPQP